MTNARKRLIYVCTSGMIAALYTALTVLLQPISFGPVQCRISEALCILPAFTPAAIPGLTLGCLLSAVFTGAIWQDTVFGSLATLIGALGAYFLGNPGKFRFVPSRFANAGKWLIPLPTVLANTLIVPFVLAYGYQAEEGIWFLFASIAAGELLAAYLLGILLYLALRKHANKIFAL